ncbi:NAD-dependent epimerase/dehydratase family protein [Aurantimonas sp. E1-2-R+4]|uniref:NAD-dependent epimerase/dehydratase family protein n=1 Tax=Aurantimonas sp. E1-2-R+4 TaxID=3113714 RepID=UPI002F947507
MLGGTGFVGKILAARLRDISNPPPSYIVHRSRPAWLDGARVSAVEVALDDSNDFAAALKGHDVLVNLLRPDGGGWYPDLLNRLQVSLRTSGIRRCVHASSIDVYAAGEAEFVDEETPTSPRSSYEAEHLAAERVLSSVFAETVVLRLGAVFGPGGRNLLNLTNEMQRAPFWKLALRRFLYGDRRMHLVSVNSVCDALVHFSLEPGAAGLQTVLVTDDADPDNNFAFVQDRFAEAFGRRSPAGVPSLPRSALRVALRARGLSPVSASRRFSAKKAHNLGFSPHPFGEELKAYARQLAAGSQNPDV